MATIKKPIKKAESGTSVKGNSKGYNPSTSPLPNTINKGGYEKTLDKVGNTLILRGGDKKEISRAQIGTKQEDALRKSYNAKKQDTNDRRTENTNFLESRQKTGEVANKLKSGGNIKKAQSGTSIVKKNIKDATQNKNMRPPFPNKKSAGPHVPNTSGNARNGKKLTK